ncbi:ATP-binding protein [Lysobacter sp. Hz 25]|uniref:ATP-binding protein n=1 Tax=Lysobacter sp. Hz 25 TaxID=3383698 RepID=UPI0038D49EB6
MSGLPIITANQRLAESRGVKGVLVGRWGLGKTYQLWTLDPSSTLFIDIEAGDLAVMEWPGDSLRPRTWEECRDIAVLVGGPNPALRDGQSFSQWHFNEARQRFGDPEKLTKYRTLFIDSITVAGRLCLQWCKGQPQAFSDRTNKPDTRGAYGLMGQEMVAWLTHIQHSRGKHVWFVGILDERSDDFNRKVYELQIDGSKTGLELPGIVDEVITLAEITTGDAPPYRAFVCHTANPWGFPAKDRSGRLDMVEPPDLGQLMRKLGAAEAAAPTDPTAY